MEIEKWKKEAGRGEGIHAVYANISVSVLWNRNGVRRHCINVASRKIEVDSLWFLNVALTSRFLSFKGNWPYVWRKGTLLSNFTSKVPRCLLWESASWAGCLWLRAAAAGRTHARGCHRMAGAVSWGRSGSTRSSPALRCFLRSYWK